MLVCTHDRPLWEEPVTPPRHRCTTANPDLSGAPPIHMPQDFLCEDVRLHCQRNFIWLVFYDILDAMVQRALRQYDEVKILHELCSHAASDKLQSGQPRTDDQRMQNDVL